MQSPAFTHGIPLFHLHDAPPPASVQVIPTGHGPPVPPHTHAGLFGNGQRRARGLVHIPSQAAVASVALPHWPLQSALVHAGAMHAVPASFTPQTPLPSQPAWQASLHAACGSSPTPTAPQVPALPCRLHARQPAHIPGGVSQHTPSTQFPLTHSAPAPHASPFVFFGAHIAPPPAQ